MQLSWNKERQEARSSGGRCSGPSKSESKLSSKSNDEEEGTALKCTEEMGKQIVMKELIRRIRGRASLGCF